MKNPKRPKIDMLYDDGRSHYPPLSEDSNPHGIVSVDDEMRVEISDIVEGETVAGVLFGKIKIKYSEESSTPTYQDKGMILDTPFYVPLLDAEGIIDYLLHGLEQSLVDRYKRRLFEPLQNALEPCVRYAERKEAYNDGTVIDLLKAEGFDLNQEPSYDDIKPEDLSRKFQRAFASVDAGFYGIQLHNMLEKPN